MKEEKRKSRYVPPASGRQKKIGGERQVITNVGTKREVSGVGSRQKGGFFGEACPGLLSSPEDFTEKK